MEHWLSARCALRGGGRYGMGYGLASVAPTRRTRLPGRILARLRSDPTRPTSLRGLGWWGLIGSLERQQEAGLRVGRAVVVREGWRSEAGMRVSTGGLEG